VLIPTLLGDTKPIGQVLKEISPRTPVTVLIGPEGDFSPAEVEMAKSKGAVPVSLGPLTLRTETAALAVLALALLWRLEA
jgi:16S rRNA (uracil1498-N3)-methyltransferase